MKQQTALAHGYPSVDGSFGGSQSWFASRTICEGGCGVIAAGDLLLYLGMHRKGCRTEEMHGLFRGDGSISRPLYERYIRRLRRRYFPLLPRLGMPYWILILGLNRYFIRHQIPLRARWGVLPRNFRRRMEEMLQADLPVIFSIGPNFPFVFRKQKLNLYGEEERDGSFPCLARTSAHYVTATAADGKKIRISSWGKSYLVDLEEYCLYVRRHSNWLMSNLCYIYETKERIRDARS